MRKKTFVIVGLLIAVLVVAVPVWAFRDSGDPQTSERKVADNMVGAKELFQTNCGACHTLYAAETDGNFGPDLDQLLAPTGPPTGKDAEATVAERKDMVLRTIEEGADSTTTIGRMPGGIIDGEQAEEVAEFVARTAGEG